MYTRPEFIKLVGSRYSELRFYERRGLLLPDDVDEKNGRRYYSENAVSVYRYIRKLQRVGYSLDEIQTHLEGIDGLTDEAFYRGRETVLREQLAGLEEIMLSPPVRYDKPKKRYEKPLAKKEKER